MITNLLFLFLVGSNITFPAISEYERDMVLWRRHDYIVPFVASTEAVSDLRDGYTVATWDGANVTCDGVVYAPYVPEPDKFPNGVWINNTNGFIIVRMPDGHDYAIVPTDDGRVIAPQVSSSPLEMDKVPGFVEAEKAKVKSTQSNRLTRIERIAVDLQQVDAQIEGTKWVDVVLTGISATAGTWSNANQRATIAAIKSALQATKDREQNLKVAVRNLMQATEKVRKELGP